MAENNKTERIEEVRVQEWPPESTKFFCVGAESPKIGENDLALLETTRADAERNHWRIVAEDNGEACIAIAPLPRSWASGDEKISLAGSYKVFDWMGLALYAKADRKGKIFEFIREHGRNVEDG